MSKYIDSKNREWNISLTIRICKRIKEETGLDFLAGGENSNPLIKLSSDSYLLVDVLYLLCEQQAKERGVSIEDFVDGYQGDAIDSAINAIASAYVNFIPNPRRRAILSKMLAKARAEETLILDKAEAEIEKETIPTTGDS